MAQTTMQNTAPLADHHMHVSVVVDTAVERRIVTDELHYRRVQFDPKDPPCSAQEREQDVFAAAGADDRDVAVRSGSKG